MSVNKLFYQNPYQTNFSATVLSCVPHSANFAIELDATCFYPEGGGQPADRGMLGGANVLDVQEKDGVIRHITDIAMTVGEIIHAKIDWPRRFLFMQHHTGEHIVSGIIHKMFKLDNVGFHMGSAAVTVDFNGDLSSEQLAAVELEANRTIFSDISVQALYPDSEALACLDYRSKKALSGEVRIVSVPGVDCCACCGVHVAKTGEIGLVKLLSPQRYKGGTRFVLLCGEWALADYRQKDDSILHVSRSLSAKPAEVAAAVQRVLNENDMLKAALTAVKDKLFGMRLETVDREEKFIALFEDDLSPAELGRFCLRLIERRPGPCLLLSGCDQDGYRYALGIADGDARTLSAQMHKALGGNGGGNVRLAQGAIPAERRRIIDYVAL